MLGAWKIDEGWRLQKNTTDKINNEYSIGHEENTHTSLRTQTTRAQTTLTDSTGNRTLKTNERGGTCNRNLNNYAGQTNGKWCQRLNQRRRDWNGRKKERRKWAKKSNIVDPPPARNPLISLLNEILKGHYTNKTSKIINSIVYSFTIVPLFYYLLHSCWGHYCDLTHKTLDHFKRMLSPKWSPV